MCVRVRASGRCVCACVPQTAIVRRSLNQSGKEGAPWPCHETRTHGAAGDGMARHGSAWWDKAQAALPCLPPPPATPHLYRQPQSIFALEDKGQENKPMATIRGGASWRRRGKGEGGLRGREEDAFLSSRHVPYVVVSLLLFSFSSLSRAFFCCFCFVRRVQRALVSSNSP